MSHGACWLSYEMSEVLRQKKPNSSGGSNSLSSRPGSLRRIMPSRNETRSSDKEAFTSRPPSIPSPNLSSSLSSGSKPVVQTTDFAHLVFKYDCQAKSGCERIAPKLAGSLGGQSSYERRKSDHQTSLAQAAHEVGSELGETLLGQVLSLYSEVSNNVSVEKTLYDLAVEQKVIRPLRDMLGCTSAERVESTEKLQKRLIKSTAEVQLLSTKAQKLDEKGSKDDVERIRRDLNAAVERNQALQSQFDTEVFEEAAGKDMAVAQILSDLLTDRIKFFEGSLKHLRESRVKLKNVIDTSTHRPVFGCSLEEHCTASNRDVSLVIESCCAALQPHIQIEAGIFRLAGPATQIRKVRASLDVGIVDLADCSPHTIACVLKQYLRELPDPLMMAEKQEVWAELANMDGAKREQRDQRLFQHVHELPNAHYDNLRYLIIFLNEMCQYKDVTKMGPSNLALVIGPNMIQLPADEAASFQLTKDICVILEELIANCHQYFPEGAQIKSTTPSHTGLARTLQDIQHKKFAYRMEFASYSQEGGRRKSYSNIPDLGDSLQRLASHHSSSSDYVDGDNSSAPSSKEALSSDHNMFGSDTTPDDNALHTPTSVNYLSADGGSITAINFSGEGSQNRSEKRKTRLMSQTIRNALRKHKRLQMESQSSVDGSTQSPEQADNPLAQP